MAILARSDVERILSITDTTIPDKLLDWAEAQTEKMLDKSYDETEVTKHYYPRASQKYLNLDHTDIVSVEYIKIDGTAVDSDSYNVYKEEGMIILKSSTDVELYSDYLVYFPKDGDIEIKYTYGGDTVGELDKYICFLLLFKELLRTRPDMITKQAIEEHIGDYSIRYNVEDLKKRPDEIDKDIQRAVSIERDDDDNYTVAL